MCASIFRRSWGIVGVVVLLGLGAALPRHHVVAAPLAQEPPPSVLPSPSASGSPSPSPSPSTPPASNWWDLPDPSEIAREAWHEALYAIERLVATFFWTLDRAILNVISLVEQWRGQLITAGFRPVIQTVADTLVTLAPGILALGFVLGLLLILLRPALNLSLVNVRKVLVYAALIPVLFPLAGATFQALEETRANFGGWFFNTGASLVGFDLGGEGTGAPNTTMGKVVAYDRTLYSDPNVRHGIDVAAAYLYATKDDVTSARDLPAAFEQEFFPVPTLTNLDATQRWERIKQGAQGIVRASFGILLVLVALCESAINLVFTVGLGFLLIGFGIGVVLGWFSPVEAIAARMGQEVIQVLIGSWGISGAQGLLIAALLAVAQTGNADAVFGMGVVALVLECIFLVAAAKTLFNGFAGATGALTGGTVSAQEVAAGAALAGSTMLGGGAAGYGTIRAVERGGGALASGAMSAAGGALRMGSAFRYARQLNDGTSGSTRLAIGAAMSQSPSLAQAGTLAAMMGFTQPGGHFERGLTTGAVAGRGDPLRTHAALRTDAQARTVEAFDTAIDQAKQRTMRDDQVARNVSWTPSPQRDTRDTQPLAPHTNATQPLTPAAAPPARPGGGSQRPQRRGPRAQRQQAGAGQPVQARAKQRRQQRVAAQQTQRQAAHAQRWQAWQQRQQARPQQPRRGRRFASTKRPTPKQAVDAVAPDTATDAATMMQPLAPRAAPPAAPRPAQQRRPRQGPRMQRAQRGPRQRQPVQARAQHQQAAQQQPVQARAQQRRQQRVAAQQTQRQAAHAQRWQAWQQRQQARPQHVSRGRRFAPKLRPAPVQATEGEAPDTAIGAAPVMQPGAPTSAARLAAPAPRMRPAVVVVSGGSRLRPHAASRSRRAQRPTITLGERVVRQPARPTQTLAPMSAAPRIITTGTRQRAATLRRAPRGRATQPIAAVRAAAQRRAPTTTSEEEEQE